MRVTDVINSSIDDSMNVILRTDDNEVFEARAVQRTKDTLIIYLSSSSGCDLSCRFCHLTQTGQTSTIHATVDDYVDQAEAVLNHLLGERLTDVKTIHYNFMARGDALSNPHFVLNFRVLYEQLKNLASYYKQEAVVKFKISTIFPCDGILHKAGGYAGDWIWEEVLALDPNIEFYYSLYSLKPEFRKKWIPKGLDPEEVGRLFTGIDQGLVIHHALISGQNDSEEDVALIHQWLERHDIRTEMNIVRYNPYDQRSGEEASQTKIDTYAMRMNLSHRILDFQIIPKVGTDVKAACGMFIEK